MPNKSKKNKKTKAKAFEKRLKAVENRLDEKSAQGDVQQKQWRFTMYLIGFFSLAGLILNIISALRK